MMQPYSALQRIPSEDIPLNCVADAYYSAAIGAASVTFVQSFKQAGTGGDLVIPAHEVGDLLVVFIRNSAGTANPTEPSGWNTAGTAPSGSTQGYRIVWRIDTAGTLSLVSAFNANMLFGIILRGAVSGVGSAAISPYDSSGSSKTIPGLSLTNTYGQSWVVAGIQTGSASGITDPASHTRAYDNLVPNLGGGPTVGWYAQPTGASYAGATVSWTGSSSNSTWAIEIKAGARPAARTTLFLDGESLLDVSDDPKTVNAFGGVQVSSGQSRFGATSIFFDGTGDYLTCDGALPSGTEDFTLEFFCWTSSLPSSGNVRSFSRWANTTGINLELTSAGQIGLFSPSPFGYVAGGSLPLSVWNHIALVRVGGVFFVYLNGVQVSTLVNAASLRPARLEIGYDVGTPTRAWVGYFQNYRVTRGVARYTAAFTPPALTFCDFSGGVPAPITPPPAPPPSPAPSTRAYVVRGAPALYRPGVALDAVSGFAGFVETPGGSYPGDTALLSATVSASEVPPGISSFPVLTNTAPFPFTVTIRAIGTPTTVGSYNTILNVLLAGNIVASGVWPVTVSSVPELTVVVPTTNITLPRGVAVDLVIATLSTDIPATITFIGEPVWFAAAGLSLDLTWASTSGTLKIVGTPTLLVIYPAAISVAFSIDGDAGPVRAFDIRIVP